MNRTAKACVFLIYLAVHLGGLLLASASQRQSKPYINSTAVLLSEVFKCIVSILALSQANGTASATFRAIWQALFANPVQLLRVCIPAMLYTVQNNLIYAALSHLDAVSFQITYQLKIIASILSVRVLLKRSISTAKWVSVALLAIGVSLVQLSLREDEAADEVPEQGRQRNYMLGLLGVLIACLCSGLGGATMELLLKEGEQSLPARNLQVAFISLILACAHMWNADKQAVLNGGLFQGYSAVVWAMVMLDGCGGLLVSILLKYTSSMLKNFAAPLGIILNCLLSRYTSRSGQKPSKKFVLGTLLTLLALGMFNVAG